MRRFASLVLLLVVAAGVAATNSTPSLAGASAGRRATRDDNDAGSLGLRLLDVPVVSAYDPRARQYIVDNLVPGTVIHRRIELWNQTATRLHVAVYPDAAHIAHGAFIGGRGHTVNDLVTWTRVSQPSLDIPPGARARDIITIAIPKDAPPGERYAVVWAEVHSPAAGNIALVNRLGTRVYLSVGGFNAPATNFTVDTLTAARDAQDRPVVEALVHDTGGRALDLTGSLTLTKTSGGLRSTAGPYPVQLGTTLAPGQSESVKTIITDPLSDGPWDATIELRSGLVNKKYHGKLTFPSVTGSTAPVAAHPRTTTRHLAMISGALAVFVLLGVAAVPATRRFRNKNVAEP